MNVLRPLLSLLLLAALPRAAAQPVPASPPQTMAVDGFAAMVNGTVITAGDVLEFTASERRDARRRLAGRDLVLEQSRLFDEGLERLIERQLILEAYKTLGGQLPEGAVRERTDTILRENFNGDRNQLLATLRAVGSSEREWQDDIRDQLIIQQLTQQFVTRRIQITPRMVKDRYDASPDRFRTPVELRLQVLALRPVPEAELPERTAFLSALHQQARGGADFTELVRQHSQAPNAADGGIQDWVRLTTLPGALRTGLEPLQPGQISEPLFAPTQHYLFKVLDRRGGDIMPLAEAQPALESELRREEYDRIHAEWIDSLRQQFPVTIYTPQESTIQRSN